jgi:nicotinamidase-related amidase
MSEGSHKNEALVIVDMQNDNVGRFCIHIIPKIRLLIEKARRKGAIIVYACDSRYGDDELFGRVGMKPHTIRGTEGTEVIAELDPQPSDIVVEKRMLSAFFGTDLDFTLRQKRVTRLIITGIRTEACLLKTVLDAFELGYEVLVPQDACASPSIQNHEATLKSLEILKIQQTKAEELLES